MHVKHLVFIVISILIIAFYRFSGCCWPDSSFWDLKIFVDAANKLPQAVNTSPVTLMLPLIQIQYGCGQGTIYIPGMCVF